MNARIVRERWQPSTVLAVAIVWTLLWDRLSLGNLVNGLLVGLLVTWVFPLPLLQTAGRIRPLRVLAVLGRFLVDLTRASLDVAWLAFSRRTPHNAVIGVTLRTHDDLVLTLVALITGLVPGSVVVEARRSSSELYLHLLDVHTPEDLDRARVNVLDLERRIVQAIGSADQISAVKETER